jgi:hypothetical protein
MRIITFLSNLKLRSGLQWLIVLALIAGAFSLSSFQTQAAAIPVFTISAVEKGNLVTIVTDNFPANKTFVVRMGKFGTLGVGGTEVGTTYSGAGGSFTASYSIPADLKGQDRLAIRLDATSGGYYSYNWFWNNTQQAVQTSTPAATQIATPTATPSVPIPTFTIETVVKGSSVTIKTANFPANKTFTVRMGKYGTRGIDGIVVGTTFSGTGGVFTATYNIPTDLQADARIHLRLESTTGGYYSYNWFWNNPTASVTPTPGSGTSYSGIPTISIASVIKDSSVTITTNNFPKNRTFTVRMGKFGTLGIGGSDVGTLISETGGTITATFIIPEELKGQSLIAIRLDSTSGGFYSFNWFRNK